MAAEVISVDLNNYNDANEYTGEAAVPGATVWRAYYAGWGKPVGSPRSANLADFNEPNKPGTYAAQVWIGDPGTNHTYESGTGLMDDGFVNDPCVAGEPNISLFAVPDFPFTDGDAYGGTFDIYVYGAADGNFTLESPVYGPNTKAVTGGFTGDFNEGQNYVIFEDILIDDTNTVILSYSNKLNGLQLVSDKQPVAIRDVLRLDVTDYDVAYETNARAGEIHEFGPDTGEVNDPWEGIMPSVFYLDTDEYMEYEITVDEANEGYYQIDAYVRTQYGPADDLDIYLDNIFLGTLSYTLTSTYFVKTSNPVSVNLFEGSHTFKWVSTGPELYFDLSDFEFDRVSDVVINDCNDVYKYGLNYASDYNRDCHVDERDLALMVDNWLNCYDPNVDNCP